MPSLTAFSVPPYPLAIAAITNITFIGNGIVVDSFNSSNPNSSDWDTNAGYGTYDSAKAMAHGDIGTDSSSVGAISVANANIYGHVNTGPNGTTTISVNGYVGPLPQTGVGITPGYSNDTMNVTFPDVFLPANANGWAGISDNAVITASGLYFASSISNNLTVNAPNVTIYVAGNISLSGTQSIVVASSATNVTIYVRGPSLIASGNATGLNSLTQRASALSILGLPTLTNISIASTNSNCTIYAPEADFSLGGGGTFRYDFVGAIAVKSVKLTGHPAFHFDQSLAQSIPISIIPVNSVVQRGANANFAISPGGAYAFSYQWFFDQTNPIAGATNSVLSLTNVQLSDAGVYSVVAGSWFNSVTSSPASLIVFTNAAATLTSAALVTNGIQFSVTGISGLSYVVQSSTNLATWISLATNQSPFIFTDTNILAFSQQFYRVVFDPP